MVIGSAVIKGYEMAGVDPAIMGIGPINAVKNALRKAGLSVADLDLMTSLYVLVGGKGFVRVISR